MLAAGGTADARRFAEVMAAGAEGVRIGMRFVAATESAARPANTQAIVDAIGDCTVIGDTFVRDCPLGATRARHRVVRRAADRGLRRSKVTSSGR